MTGGRRALVSIACLACALLLPATVWAAKLDGNTSQKGERIGLKTNVRGEVTMARISWTAPCRYGGKIRGSSRFGTPFDRSGPGGFRSTARDRGRDGDLRLTAKDMIEGTKAADGSYSGTFKVTLRYTKHGKYFSTCKSKRVRWSAQPR